jgi:hypothetical protein
MATIVPTFSKIRGPAGGVDAVVTTWTPLAAAGDVGQPLQRTDLADRSIQVTGTFAGATIVLEGSNDGANYFTLSNPAGTAPRSRRRASCRSTNRPPGCARASASAAAPASP